MIYVAMIKAQSRYWLLMHPHEETYHVAAWNTEEEAVALYEELYERSIALHGANSTAIGFMFSRPCIVPLEDESDEYLARIVVNEPVLTSVSSVGSHFMGIEVRPDTSDLLWTMGREVRLLHETISQ